MTYKYIDIESDKFKFINEINQCKYIASSSLHGIIISHAYGIPATWIKLSNNLKGDNFKFQDYALSTGNNIDYVKVGNELYLEKIIQKSFLFNNRDNIKLFLKSLHDSNLAVKINAK